MLRNYLDSKIEQIPFIKELLVVDSRDGKVFSPTGDFIRSRERSDGGVEYHVTMKHKTVWVKKSHLVVWAYKKPNLPINLLNKIQVKFFDGNKNNCSPKNLIYCFPEGGLEVPNRPKFYYIPAATKYAISKDGDVIRIADKKESTIIKHNYQQARIELDVGPNIYKPHHRLMAMSFLDVPAQADLLVVNHKDCDKYNNAIDNLEWCSVGENLQHAVKNGRLFYYPIEMVEVDQNQSVCGSRPVLVKDIRDNSVWRYPSLTVCALSIGLNTSTVHSYLNSPKMKIHRRYFVFKYEDDLRDWPEFTEKDSVEWEQGFYKETIARNIKTKEIIITSSISEMAKVINVNEQTLMFRLRESNKSWPINGWDVQPYFGKKIKWPQWEIDEVEFFLNNKPKDNPIVAIKTNERKIFSNSNDIGRFLNVPGHRVKKRLKGGHPLKGYSFHVLLYDEKERKTYLRAHTFKNQRAPRPDLENKVKAQNIYTGEIIEKDKITDLAKYIGCNEMYLTSRIRKNVPWPINGWVVRLKSDKSSWPKWNETELDFFQNHSPSSSPYLVVWSKINERKMFQSLNEIGELFNHTKSTICQYMLKKLEHPTKHFRVYRVNFDSVNQCTCIK